MGTLNDWLQKWKMDKLSINAGFLRAELSFKDADKKAAWELYVEMLTRVATQDLQPDHGDEGTALTSIFSLFALTRQIIKKNGSGCIQFSKIAIIVLNQIIRPFTAKWHKISLANGFDNSELCKEFRKELSELQKNLRIYTRMLADMAEVEDLTNLQQL